MGEEMAGPEKDFGLSEPISEDAMQAIAEGMSQADRDMAAMAGLKLFGENWVEKVAAMRQLKGLPRSSKAEVLQEATTWVALVVSELAHHSDIIVPFAQEIHALTPCGMRH